MRAPGRYSRFVRAMRIALPLGAFALLAVLLAWPRLHGPEGDVATPTADGVDLERDGRVRLDHPRYVGEGGAARGFTVEAEAARVDPTAPRRIELERMRAELPARGGRDVAVEAGHAVYDRDRAVLDLDGGIEVVTDDGYHLWTEAAEIAIEAGRLRTRAPVEGEGPAGDLAADRLEVTERGDVLRFTGDVRVRLHDADGGHGAASGAGS
jgi:lipopolysaccharide export system protein LptC